MVSEPVVTVLAIEEPEIVPNSDEASTDTLSAKTLSDFTNQNALGYEANERFNTMHRFQLEFQDPVNERKADYIIDRAHTGEFQHRPQPRS